MFGTDNFYFSTIAKEGVFGNIQQLPFQNPRRFVNRCSAEAPNSSDTEGVISRVLQFVPRKQWCDITRQITSSQMGRES
jgi:hypothetical protein